nr:sulfite exporter TauE/SafE family protein [Aureivirga sp. CE67]
MKMTTLLLAILIGVCAGMLSGLVGVGGGILMVPMFAYFLGLTHHNAQGMSLAVMLPPVTILAVMNYHKSEPIDWKIAAVVAAFFIIGGFFGSKIALVINQAMLKKIFGVIMIIVALKLIFSK